MEDGEKNNPYNKLEEWLNEAKFKEKGIEPIAMVLSTLDEKLFPSSRYVVLSSISKQKGLSFCTNYKSRKSKNLIENSPFCSCFFSWPSLNKKIEIVGYVKKCDFEENNKFFEEKNFKSKIGFIVPLQGENITESQKREQVSNII